MDFTQRISSAEPNCTVCGYHSVWMDLSKLSSKRKQHLHNSDFHRDSPEMRDK